MARTRGATGNWYICTATSRKPSDSLPRPRKAHLLMRFRIRAVSDLLEPCEAKVSSTVLRGGGGGDTLSLPGEVSDGLRLPDPPEAFLLLRQQNESRRTALQSLSDGA